MAKYFKFQMKNALTSTGFIRILIFMTAFGVVSFIVKCIFVYQSDILSVQVAFSQFFFNGFNDEYVAIFSIIFPFACCAVFSDSYISDSTRNYIGICLIKGNIKQYFFSKMLAVFACGFLVIFAPQIVNFFFA